MTDKSHTLMGMYMIHKGAYKWGCKRCVWIYVCYECDFSFFSLQRVSYRSVKCREEVFHSMSVLKRVCRWNQVFSLQKLTLYINVSLLAIVGLTWLKAFFLVAIIAFILHVDLYYTSSFHYTPVFSHVRGFLYSAAEAVKSFIVEFNLVNILWWGWEETCLTQCC